MQYTLVDILHSCRYLHVWKFIDTVRRNLILVTTESERVTYRKLINMGQGKTLGFPGGCKACLRCKTVIRYVARNEPALPPPPPPFHGGRDISRDDYRRGKQTKIYEMRKEIFFDIIILCTYLFIFILLIYLFVYVFLVSFQGQLNKIKWYIQDLWKTT